MPTYFVIYRERGKNEFTAERIFRYCPHNHKSIDAAVRCAKRLMRELRAAPHAAAATPKE